MSIEHATLYVVATPIGNLGDISARALEILSSVALVASEDTRHTRPLLRHFGIRTPLVPLHDHNERQQAPRLVDRLRAGESIALVSDAGTPLVSDPGYHMIRAARDAGIRVSPVPGACAAIAALSVSGLPVDRFAFEGFLPARAPARKRALDALRDETRTLVFYEAVHRVRDALRDMADTLGATRKACIARELTKLHETVRDGSLAELVDWAAEDAGVTKGELAIVVAGADPSPGGAAVNAFALATLLAEDLPAPRAAQLASRISGVPRKVLYRYLVDHP